MNTIQKFNSVTAFHDYINNRPTQKNWEGQERWSEAAERGCKGVTTKSFEHAEELFIHGDRETYEKIKAVAASHVRPQYRAQRQLYSAVVGCAPNVAAFVVGAPNAMIAQRMVHVKRKVVNVLFNNCWAWFDDGQKIIEASLSVMEKILALEAIGVRVNLYTATIVKEKRRKNERGKGDKRHGYFIKIKDARQAPDILKMTYPMVNDSMLRRQGFRYMETTEGIPHDSGYHLCEEDEDVIKKEAEKNGIKNAVILTGRNLLHMSKGERTRYIDERIAQA